MILNEKKWNCYVFLDFFLKKKDICTICYQYKLIFLLQKCRLCNWGQMAGIFFKMCCFWRWPRIPCKITNYHLLLNQKVKNEYIYIFDELKIKFKHQKHSWNAWKTTSNRNKISKKKGCPSLIQGHLLTKTDNKWKQTDQILFGDEVYPIFKVFCIETQLLVPQNKLLSSLQ